MSGGPPLADLLDMAFMRHALLAGIPVAALSGFVGWFMVLRSQVFTGDALSHVAFTGALGSLALGVSPQLGLLVCTVVVGVGLGLLGGRGRADDVVIGTVFAWVLGLGVLALSLYTASSAGTTAGSAGVSVLFGSIFGLSATAAWTAAGVSVGLLLLLGLLARPLLFASLDEAVAAARGVPVRALGLLFLAVVGATAAQATQAVGALLLLGLLAAPAGAARRLTDRPYLGMALASGISVASMVLGLLASYLLPQVPPSFGILTVAALSYGLSPLVGRRRAGPRSARVRTAGGNRPPPR